jgi:hypothetical protein
LHPWPICAKTALLGCGKDLALNRECDDGIVAGDTGALIEQRASWRPTAFICLAMARVARKPALVMNSRLESHVDLTGIGLRVVYELWDASDLERGEWKQVSSILRRAQRRISQKG